MVVVEKGFEFLEHTADFKFRSFGESLEEAFSNAGKALFAHIIGLDSMEGREERKVEAHAPNREELLHDFLSELIFLFEDQQLLFREFKVEINENRLSATCLGEKYDPEKHQLLAEVKAVTYHDMKIEKHNSVWNIEVLCDT